MGYYSNFELIDTDIPNNLEVLNLFDEDVWGGSPGWEEYNGTVQSEDSTKWYDWLDDLAQLAVKYPENYLIIERTGEESPDVSRAYVQNGKVEEVRPEIVWPDFF